MGSKWTEYTLGDLGRIVTGKTPLKSVEGNFGGSVPFVTPRDLDGARIVKQTERFLSEQGAQSVKNSRIPANSVLVSCIGSDMGKAALIKEASVTNQQINAIIVDPEFDSNFVYYVLSGRKQEIRDAAGGSAQPILNKTHFSQLEITLPPLSEQKAIAHILGTLDDKIELNRRMNATLEGMAQALFKSWFVDFDPVIDNALAAGNPIPDELAARAEVRRQALANGTANREAAKAFPDSFQETEELGWIPEGWAAGCIADLCNTVTDGSHHSPKSVDKESGLPMASSKDLTNLGINYESCRFISKEDFSDLERNGCSPQVGDVLIAKDGARCGETCCIHGEEEPVVLLSSVAILRPKSPNLSTFLNTLMSRAESVADLRENYVSGSAIPRIILRDFKRFPVITFPQSILETWFLDSQALHQRATDSKKQSETLSRLRDTLLPKLISGELRIPETEQLTEEVPA